MDPILETIWAFVQTIMANPIAAGAIYGVIRNITGYLQKKYKEKTGQEYDPKVLGADILKYEVAVNSIFATLPPDTAGKIAPLVMIADIVFSAAKKLKGTTTSIVKEPKPEVPTESIPSVTPYPKENIPIYSSWIQEVGGTGWVRNVSYDNGVTYTQQEYNQINPDAIKSQIIPPIAVPKEPILTYGEWVKAEDATGRALWARAIYTDGIKLKGMNGWQYSKTDPAVAITPP